MVSVPNMRGSQRFTTGHSEIQELLEPPQVALVHSFGALAAAFNAGPVLQQRREDGRLVGSHVHGQGVLHGVRHSKPLRDLSAPPRKGEVRAHPRRLLLC